MIVTNIGYLSKDKVNKCYQNELPFAIYKTHKNTEILVFYHELYYKNTDNIHLYQPKHDRLPYKIIEGKKIAYNCIKTFDSTNNSFDVIDYTLWNGRKQIMCYLPFTNSWGTSTYSEKLFNFLKKIET